MYRSSRSSHLTLFSFSQVRCVLVLSSAYAVVYCTAHSNILSLHILTSVQFSSVQYCTAHSKILSLHMLTTDISYLAGRHRPTDDEDLLLGGASETPLPGAYQSLKQRGVTFTNWFVHTPVRRACVSSPTTAAIYYSFSVCLSLHILTTDNTYTDWVTRSNNTHAHGPTTRTHTHTHTHTQLQTHKCIKVCCPSRSEILTGKYFHSLARTPPNRWDAQPNGMAYQCTKHDPAGICNNSKT